MKRFDFRLKSVLVLRQRLLNEAERVYGLAIKDRQNIELQIESAALELDVMNEKMMAIRGNRFCGGQQESYFNSMRQARVSIDELHQKLRKAQQIEQFKRRKYIEANRDYELLVKLREKQQQKHFQEELLKEQLVQDDLFNARRAVLNRAQVS